MPFATHYKVDGQGRDSYINIDNGGLQARYQPAMNVVGGNISNKKFEERSLCNIPSKHVGYFSNGTGRDGYICRTNGGFYPEQPIAAYQRTFVNQLRVGYARTPMNPKNQLRARSSLRIKQLYKEYE